MDIALLNVQRTLELSIFSYNERALPGIPGLFLFILITSLFFFHSLHDSLMAELCILESQRAKTIFDDLITQCMLDNLAIPLML